MAVVLAVLVLASGLKESASAGTRALAPTSTLGVTAEDFDSCSFRNFLQSVIGGRIWGPVELPESTMSELPKPTFWWRNHVHESPFSPPLDK